jgi:hypothetical protein
MIKTESNLAAYRTLQETAIIAYAYILKKAGWSDFEKHLKFLIQKLETSSRMEKVLVKLVCEILNNLEQFNLTDIVEQVHNHFSNN